MHAILALTLSLGALCTLVAAFEPDFNFCLTTAIQCAGMTVTVQGGSPPYRLVIVPLSSIPPIVVPFSGANTSFDLNLPQGTQFTAFMGDANGYTTEGVSPVYTVAPSHDTTCISAYPEPLFEFFVNPQKVTQCGATVFSADSRAQGTVTVIGVVPGVETHTISFPANSTYTWTADVCASKTLIFVAGDDRGVGSGGSSTSLVVQSGPSYCIHTTSSSSPPASTSTGSTSQTGSVGTGVRTTQTPGTGSSSYPSGYPSSYSATQTQTNGNSSSGAANYGGSSTASSSVQTGNEFAQRNSHVGAIAGGVVGGVVGLALLAGLLLFCCCCGGARKGRNYVHDHFSSTVNNQYVDFEGNTAYVAHSAGGRRQEMTQTGVRSESSNPFGDEHRASGSRAASARDSGTGSVGYSGQLPMSHGAFTFSSFRHPSESGPHGPTPPSTLSWSAGEMLGGAAVVAGLGGMKRTKTDGDLEGGMRLSGYSSHERNAATQGAEGMRAVDDQRNATFGHGGSMGIAGNDRSAYASEITTNQNTAAGRDFASGESNANGGAAARTGAWESSSQGANAGAVIGAVGATTGSAERHSRDVAERHEDDGLQKVVYSSTRTKSAGDLPFRTRVTFSRTASTDYGENLYAPDSLSAEEGYTSGGRSTYADGTGSKSTAGGSVGGSTALVGSHMQQSVTRPARAAVTERYESSTSRSGALTGDAEHASGGRSMHAGGAEFTGDGLGSETTAVAGSHEGGIVTRPARAAVPDSFAGSSSRLGASAFVSAQDEGGENAISQSRSQMVTRSGTNRERSDYFSSSTGTAREASTAQGDGVEVSAKSAAGPSAWHGRFSTYTSNTESSEEERAGHFTFDGPPTQESGMTRPTSWAESSDDAEDSFIRFSSISSGRRPIKARASHPDRAGLPSSWRSSTRIEGETESDEAAAVSHEQR